MNVTIENRVVGMQFDNRNFENNVSETMSTLDKFKAKLNMEGATKGLENVDAAAKKVDMSPLSEGVQTVGLKFNAMYTIADQALRNITNAAMNAGKRIISALTIDPVKTGFSEYETKINAIQTIMSNTASKGTTMEDVTRVIGELNTYADKTIYNFAEMTRNIGTFTAAGVGLEDSAAAIQGIANLAAASGSTSQQASTAMYQLSQALAAGSVKLMDWNSVVNAGMGGEKFQEALKATARDHGVAVDELIKKNGSFRESLQEGWISADILNETLRKFTVEGAKEYSKSMMESGKWTQEQADALIKEAQSMEDAATKVKTFTQLWDTLKESAQSGWSQSWEIIVGDFEEAKETLTNASEVIGEIIGKSAEARNALLQGWKDAGGRKDLIDSFWNLFEAVRSVIKPIKEAFREIFPPMTVDKLVKVTSNLKSLTERLKLSEATSDKLKRTFAGLFAILDIGKQAISAVFKILGSLFGVVSELSGGVLGATASIGDWLVKLNEAIKKNNIFEKSVEKIKGAFKAIGDFLKPVIEGVKEFGSIVAETFTEAADLAKERISPLAALATFIKNVFGAIGKALQKVAPFIFAAAKGIGNVFGDLFNKITSAIQNADYDSLFDIVNGGVITAIGVFIAKFIKSAGGILDNASGFVENLKGILGGVGDVLGAFAQSIKAEALKKIAVAIAILAVSLVVLSMIDSEKLSTAIFAISTLFTELMLSMKLFGGIKAKGMLKAAAALVVISAAILILSAALKVMATMSWDEMSVGLIGIAGGLGVLVVAVNLLPERKVNSAGRAVKKLSTALLILSVALKIMSTMSFKEMGVALISAAVGMGVMVAAVNLLPKSTAIKTLGMIGLAMAMVVLAGALKLMATMSWDDVGRSLISLAGSMTVLVAALRLMKSGIPGALAMVIIAPALLMLGGALKILSTFSWDEILRSMTALAGSLAIISVAMLSMKRALPGAAALLVISAALLVFTPVLKMFASMSWKDIARGLTALAGSFVVLGVAGLVLKPLIPTLLKLSGVMVLFGVGCALVGVGVLALSAGLVALAAAGGTVALAIVTIISSIIGLIPYLIEQIGVGIVRLLDVIAGAASSIFKAVSTIINSLMDALVASVPKIVDGLLVLIDSLLKSLIQYTPSIVDGIVDFFIILMDKLAARLPELVDSALNLVMTLLTELVSAMKNIDMTTLIEGIAAAGLVASMMHVFKLAGKAGVGAMKGVLLVGAVIAELIVILAAIGGIAQIPGLTWLVEEGGKLLEALGTSLGQFIGGFVGGIAQGFTSSLPQIATDLSEFMINLQPFIAGASMFDSSTLDGVYSLVGVILALTGAGLIDAMTSWLTGGSSMAKFGEELAEFGPNMKAFADSVAGIDAGAVEASARAAKALALMAQAVPNEGGIVAWFTGENSLAKFSGELVDLGNGLAKFSMATADVNPENVVAAAQAAKALAEMAHEVPNEGGIVAWFTGENSLAKFSSELVDLGEGLNGFSKATADVNPENITAAAQAGKALAEMAQEVPNEGGVVAWFTGENSLAKFGSELEELGIGLSKFSEATVNVNPETMSAASKAAKLLAEMTATIPNEGGVASWFAGENSISKFSGDLEALGIGMSKFSDATVNVNPETMIAAAQAAESIAVMCGAIPNEGGVVAWFAGDNSVSKFAGELENLGIGMSKFSIATENVDPETVMAAAQAGKALAEMASIIPNEGGVVSWFAGENSLAAFAYQFGPLGEGLSALSVATENVNPENIAAVAKAGKALAEMANTIPNEGGVVSWFTGENSLAAFADQFAPLGRGIKALSDATEGVNPENIVAAAKAGKALAEMADKIPNQGGVASWFAGENSMAAFASEFPALGHGLKKFSDAVQGIVPENVTAAAGAAKDLANMADKIPDSDDCGKIAVFGAHILRFGPQLSAFFSATGEISSSAIGVTTQVVTAVKQFTSLNADKMASSAQALNVMNVSLKNLATVPKDCAAGFMSAMIDLSKLSIDTFITSFSKIKEKIKMVAQEAISEFTKGVKDNISKAKDACAKLVTDCADKLKATTGNFESAGKNVVNGFANGISSNAYIAVAKARLMAQSAVKAAREELKIKSPSRVFYSIGSYAGEGFVNALDAYGDKSYEASSGMANSAKQGLREAMVRIGDIINNDLDMQPTIRPVLDLSDVRANTGTLNRLFNGSSIGVMTNIGAIGSMMKTRGAGSGNGDLVSAINALRNDLGKVGNTSYNINGVTYDDGSNIYDAVQSIVRAAKMERRV